MQDLTIIKKLYELIELVGKQEAYEVLDRALDEWVKEMARDHVLGEIQDQRREEDGE